MKLFLMWFIIAIIIVALLHNAAGATAIIMSGGDFVRGETGALTGASATKGTFTSSGGSKISLG